MIKWGALAIATTVAATALVSSAGAAPQGASSATVNLSSRAAASSYLRSLGLNPHRFVIQRGTHNYAGPNCPGKRWTCTTSTRVLQVAQQAGRTNSANCGPSGTIITDQPQDCEVVQVNTDGSNTAVCNQSSGDPNASQDCDLFQTNSGGGGNTVTVSQNISPEGGTPQNMTQATDIRQDNTSGSNNATISQVVSASTSGCCNPSQDASQSLSLTQNTTTGDNHADDVNQSLSESAFSSTSEGAITQSQNTGAKSPNTNTGITQNSNSEGGGANSVTLTQSHNLSEIASGSPSSVNQLQGSPNGGMNSVVDQTSSGQSTLSTTQTETQDASVDVASTVPVTHTQYGPQWADPQQGNSSDSSNLSQSSTQTGAGTGLQSDQEYAYCDSVGVCNVGQGVTQNGQSFGNSCNDQQHCFTGLIGANGQQVPCTGACPPPQPPPPPLENPSNTTPPSCALIGTQAGPPKKILIQVQDAQGLANITVAPITNATYTIDPSSYAGSTSPVVITATKTDQSQGSFVRLTITDTAGQRTICDPIVPAVKTHKHKHAARKARGNVSAAPGLLLRLDASQRVYGQPKPLTITGTVPSGKAGEQVALLSRTCGFTGAAHLATLTTGAGGVFRYSYEPAISASFAVRWNNLTSTGKAVRVQPAIAFKKIGNGRYRVDVSTTNGVFLDGTKVTLEALAGGHWTPVGQAVLAKNSPIDVMTAVSSATIAKAVAGKKLRARVPATACYAPAASAAISG